MSNHARMIIDRLSKPAEGTLLRPDQLHYAHELGVESITGCKYIAGELFQLISEHHGDRAARRIFAMWGTPPSRRRLQKIASSGLLDRLDLMKPKPNVQRLARQLAEENKALPKSERRGPGATNPKVLEKQIRRQVSLRAEGIKRGTWYGRFPPNRDELKKMREGLDAIAKRTDLR